MRFQIALLREFIAAQSTGKVPIAVEVDPSHVVPQIDGRYEFPAGAAFLLLISRRVAPFLMHIHINDRLPADVALRGLFMSVGQMGFHCASVDEA